MYGNSSAPPAFFVENAEGIFSAAEMDDQLISVLCLKKCRSLRQFSTNTFSDAVSPSNSFCSGDWRIAADDLDEGHSAENVASRFGFVKASEDDSLSGIRHSKADPIHHSLLHERTT